MPQARFDFDVILADLRRQREDLQIQVNDRSRSADETFALLEKIRALNQRIDDAIADRERSGSGSD